ncbi:MAG: hypothetical protein HKN69_02685 [Desulfofustis sp.]|nr:hypothetical protein [Desulfofustis sp.]
MTSYDKNGFWRTSGTYLGLTGPLLLHFTLIQSGDGRQDCLWIAFQQALGVEIEECDAVIDGIEVSATFMGSEDPLVLFVKIPA